MRKSATGHAQKARPDMRKARPDMRTFLTCRARPDMRKKHRLTDEDVLRDSTWIDLYIQSHIITLCGTVPLRKRYRSGLVERP